MECILRISSILAAGAVAAGAFGAHGLRGVISESDLAIWEKAVFYHLTHALAALLVTTLSDQWLTVSRARFVALLFIGSTCVFSGSLYLLVLLNQRWLGAVTPLGGIGMICAWLILAWSYSPREKQAG